VGTVEQVGLHLLGAAPQLRGELPLLAARVAHPDELGHVLDAMDDQPGRAAVAEHRGIDRAPVALLERSVGGADVVLLDRHHVTLAGPQHGLQRSAEAAHPGRFGVSGVVREHVEDGAADDLLALGHRRVQVRVVDGDDP